MGLLVALGLLTFFLYTQNETLKENNIKLENALEEQTQAMAAMKESGIHVCESPAEIGETVERALA